ncbi:hypothetical protein [Brevibacterium otitidis]|uniref:Uncharacterized protein n=1 Tax=Brevibacterium otitidis TaxID=53364 RepID=A0ABV5X258_9MICO|nr:hypothetical protein GCM10023233_05670 [Brevibacterium otitidis]
MTGLFGSTFGGPLQAVESYRALVIAAGPAHPLAGRRLMAAAEAAKTMLDDYGFDVETTAAEVGDELHERLASACAAGSPIRAVAVVGRLGVGLGCELSAALSGALDAEVPGLVQAIRRAQLDAGYARAVFESPVCGWIGTTVVLSLPDDVTGVQSAIQEVGAIILEVLDELDEEAADDSADSDTEADVHDLRPKVVPLNRTPSGPPRDR